MSDDYETATLKWLLGLPIDNPERDKLKDRVQYSQKTLDRLTRKYLSLSPEFKPNPTPVDARPLPTYEHWLRLAAFSAAEARVQAARDSVRCSEPKE